VEIASLDASRCKRFHTSNHNASGLDHFENRGDPRTTAPVAQPAAQAPTEAALAATPAPQRKPWSAIDTDGDGKISAVEAQTDAALLKHFPAMDADKDGFVTVAEYKAHISAKPVKKAGSQG